MNVNDFNCIYAAIECLRQATGQLNDMNHSSVTQLYDNINHYERVVKKAEEAYRRIEIE